MVRIHQQGFVSVSLNLTVQECVNCGTPFAVTDDYDTERRKDGARFYCPNGHTQWYTPGPTEADQLRAKLAEAERRNASLTADADQAWAAAAEADKARRSAERERKRIEQRVHAGVCPECHRTFSQLARHMQSKHATAAETTSQAPGDDRRACPKCGECFLYNRGMGIHMAAHRRRGEL